MRINELYNTWETGNGVFTDLNAFDVPWKVEDTSENTKIITSLNFAYHGNHSGDKNTSPIVNKFIKDEVTTPRSKLADTLFIMYGDKWARLWDAITAEYNPLNNYDMVETETPAEITHTTTPAETTTTETPAETTRTITPAETTETVKPAKTTVENGVSAFNSSDYVDDTISTTTGDINDKGTNVLTVDTAGDEKIEVNTAGNTKIEVDSAGTDVLTVQNARELTRSGNIGVTTSQQMLLSEIELRKWNYFLSVFNDIDTLLTLSIY